MSPRYAQKTTVSEERSREEIKRTLRRFGALKIAFADDELAGFAVVMFQHEQLAFKFEIRFPDPDGEEFQRTPSRRFQRNEVQAEKLYRQEVRRRWRALAVVVKAKLIAVEDGVAEFIDEFMPYVVLPGGETLKEHVKPQLQEAMRRGIAPRLNLLQLPSAREADES